MVCVGWLLQQNYSGAMGRGYEQCASCTCNKHLRWQLSLHVVAFEEVGDHGVYLAFKEVGDQGVYLAEEGIVIRRWPYCEILRDIVLVLRSYTGNGFLADEGTVIRSLRN